MDRTLNPVFAAARSAVEAVLDGAGYQLASEMHHPDSFGSAEAEYRGRHERIRLTWDGKDGWIGLSYAKIGSSNQHPSPEGWRPLDQPAVDVPQLSIRPGPTADARIAQLQAALRRHLGAAV
jgi:hypothetical protein